MNQEQILTWAREAGALVFHSNFCNSSFDFNSEQLERFAALVAAHEREACAKVCEPVEGSAYELGVYKTMQTLAAAIRARGEA